MAVLVRTTEGSGLDRYSQELARLLSVQVVTTKRYNLGIRAYSLVRELARSKQLVHWPNQHFGRYSFLASHPFVITVHDLERLCFPSSKESPWEAFGLKLDVLGVKRARHIIAVSENTKRDLVRYLKVPEERVTVVYNGVNTRVFKPTNGMNFASPFLLYVGSERPRKNLGRLLEAFARLKKSGDFPGLKLVKLGSAGRYDRFRQETLGAVRRLGLEEDVLFVGPVPDEELAVYYSSALALVYPSLYEGFGFPVLEAMACACPVIASNVSSIPEVTGGAAVLVDPYDVEALSAAMRRTLTEPRLRERLISLGLERAKLFPWSRAAEATCEIYRTVEASLRVVPALASRLVLPRREDLQKLPPQLVVSGCIGAVAASPYPAPSNLDPGQ
ncbi:MAG: glycosyltransferase family 1 protein [Dehalococcoidia bacterium]|nr:glycosyltransferase family 1 protein [Dehalococcoidia bacterium]